MKQPAFAEMIGCSPSAVAQVETEQMELSRKLAERITQETSISFNWLLANDISAPPTDITGKPYTKEVFEAFRTREDSLTDEQIKKWVLFSFGAAISRSAGVLRAAYKAKKANRYCYKLLGALADLENELNEAGNPGKAPDEGVIDLDAIPAFPRAHMSLVIAGFLQEFETPAPQRLVTPSPSKQSSPRKPAARSKTKR